VDGSSFSALWQCPSVDDSSFSVDGSVAVRCIQLLEEGAITFGDLG